MEENTITTNSEQKTPLNISPIAEYLMIGISKWMNAIGIITTIFEVLWFFIAFLALTNGIAAAGLLYLILGAIYLYPIIKTFGVASQFKEAVITRNNESLEKGFSHLKGLVTFIGIMTIIGIVIVGATVISIITAVNSAKNAIPLSL